ncbi:TPM domain-containing protein [Streptococcus minor]|uniref:TPM domain-containing protein n=1 Tax=Streptococcus minor TaxID=229549 RepID=UPI00035DD8FD|nr:TPM domain-containing protein [Streptococcus minor]
MVKKICLLILSCLCCLLVTLPVWADDTGYIRDTIGYLDASDEEILEAEAADIDQKYHFQAHFAIAESNVEDLQSYAKDLYQSEAGDADGILLVVTADKSRWHLYYGGQGESLLGLEITDLLWTSFAKESDWYMGAKSYLTTVKTRFEKPSLLVDEADLLDAQEETELLNKLNEISQRQKLDVVVLTVPSLYGQSPQDYADNFFDYNGYGQGDGRDGVLLLVNIGERDWHISTTGFAIYAITDAGLDYMSEQFLNHLSSGNYFLAFDTYADLVDEFVSQAKTDKPYDIDHLPKAPLSILWLPASALLGFVIAWLVTALLKGQLATVQPRSDAKEYMKNGSFKLTDSKDLFLYRNVTKQARPKSTSGSSGFTGGGGSSSHSSFSGGSHGGGGGKF